ncbi:hypothetical protein [Labilibaculum euxinus]
MKAKIAVIIFLAAFVIACKTTKVSTKTNRDVQTEEKRDVKECTYSTVAVAVSDVLDTQNDLAENTVVTEVVKEMSKPDTSGQQYATRITERIIAHTKTDNTRTHNARDSTTNSLVKTERADNTDLKTDSSEQLDVKEKTKSKTPGIINWAIILLVLGALVFVYFILKRYKLLK